MKEELQQAPLYKQLSDVLRKSILDGTWTPGDALPSETEIANTYSVSAGTVKRALDDLTRSNILKRVQGRGTFVNVLSEEQSFFYYWRIKVRGHDDFNAARDLKTKNLSVDYRPAKTDFEKQLVGDDGTVFYHMHRVRSFLDTPLVYEHILLPYALVDGIEGLTVTDAMYPFLQQNFNISVSDVQDNIFMDTMPKKAAKAMHWDVEKPVLCAQRRAFDINNNVFEYRISYINPDLGYYKT